MSNFIFCSERWRHLQGFFAFKFKYSQIFGKISCPFSSVGKEGCITPHKTLILGHYLPTFSTNFDTFATGRGQSNYLSIKKCPFLVLITQKLAFSTKKLHRLRSRSVSSFYGKCVWVFCLLLSTWKKEGSPCSCIFSMSKTKIRFPGLQGHKIFFLEA